MCLIAMDKSGVLTYRGSPASYRYVDGQAMDHATWGGDAQRAAVLASTDHEGTHRTPSAQPAAPEYSIAELARLAHTDTGTMSREVKRLEAAGILRSRDVGRTKVVRANQEAAFYRPLRDLVTITLGPAEVLAAELGSLDGITAAAIFGSWAARATGEPGPSPNDIDLLVIGRPDRDELHEALIRARDRLGREVNPVVVSPGQWKSSTDPFLAELAGRPTVTLPGFTGPLDVTGAR
jgi:predicted nucleotidyltransferase